MLMVQVIKQAKHGLKFFYTIRMSCDWICKGTKLNHTFFVICIHFVSLCLVFLVMNILFLTFIWVGKDFMGCH